MDISLIPSNFLHINMVDYTLSTQGSPNKLHQGACKDIRHITNYSYYSYPSIPPHYHPIMPPHIYLNIPPHPIYYFPNFTSAIMYETYVVSHHLFIPSLGYLHRQPSILTFYMLSNLLPTDISPHYLRRISEQRRIMRNKR